MDDLTPIRLVIGITGASGMAYAIRVIELLTEADVDVHVAVTAHGRRVLFEELGFKRLDPDELSRGHGGLVTVYGREDAGAAIASGSFLHRGMIIVPASSNTVGAVASGVTNTLVQRTAAVTLKERRTLVIAHRESPVSLIDLRNLAHLAEAGAVIAPLAPGFYLGPRTIEDLVDFMAARLLDLVGIPHALDVRWEEHLAHGGPGKGS